MDGTFTLTRTRGRPLAEYPARRIALVKPSALGDVVHALPVLSALRQRYPQAHISWVVNRTFEELLLGHPDLDEVIAFDRSLLKGNWLAALKKYRQLHDQLRGGQFDLVIDLQGLFRSGVMTLLTRAPRRVGLGGSREGASLFYTDIVDSPQRQSLHAVDRYWLVAQALGVGDRPRQFRVPVSVAARQWTEQTLAGWPRPWLVLAVGSAWETKRWRVEHFAALARQAHEHFGGTAIFIGTRSEAHLAQQTASLLTGPALDLSGATTLGQLAALLERADVMLANDTGPMHLAAALGRPVVAPYTCTRIALHGPYGSMAGAVATSIWCHGSYQKRCDRMDCMVELTPDRLWPPLCEVLRQWQQRGQCA